MLLSIFHNYCFWAYGGTVDTPVLGTGLARGESSNLSKPTKKISLSNNTEVQICCDRCCVEYKMLQCRGGMSRQDIVSRRLVGLRN